MNKTLLILILIISVLAFVGSIYICIVEPSLSNILIAALLVLVVAYEIWQIRRMNKGVDR